MLDRILPVLVIGCVATVASAGPGSPSKMGQSSKSSTTTTTTHEVAATYDPKAVTITFVSTATGGVQRVQANESGDARQIGLIRATLQRMADDFREADLVTAGPNRHGDVPGLAALVAAPPGAMRTLFVEIRSGAEVRFQSEDPKIVAAIHEWFDAMQAAPDRASPAMTDAHATK